MDLPQSRFLLLGGTIASCLHSHAMPHDICAEEFILNHPELAQQIQTEYINAGCDIVYVPTFGANRISLKKFGLEDKVREINKRLVSMTKEISGEKRIAGNLSSTKLSLEPFGETTFDELISIYDEQASALNEAGVDLFIIESMQSLGEARAAVLACKKYNKPILVSFYLNEKGKTQLGGTPLNCLIALQELGISAFGLDCSSGPESYEEHIQELSSFSKLPLIAKPDAGDPNPVIPFIYDLSPDMMKEEMQLLLDAGATIIGSCCGTLPEHIFALRQLLNSYTPKTKKEQPQQNNDILLSTETQFFALNNDRIEFTEPIHCQYDMTDLFLSFESDSFDVILIHIDTMDDALQFAKNAHLSHLPICIYATDEQALETALRYCHGRLMVDSQSPIEQTTLQQIASYYGAVIY